jgi:hypothetical protein
LGDVMAISPGHDDRWREPTGVYQQRSLASTFFLDPWGWVRLTAVPAAPSVMPRRSFAIAKQYPPSHRARPASPARAPKRSQLAPIPETACGSRWRCRSVRGAAPSTGSACAIHTRSPRTPPAAPSVCDHLPVCARTYAYLAGLAVAESAARLAPKTHRRLHALLSSSPRSVPRNVADGGISVHFYLRIRT